MNFNKIEPSSISENAIKLIGSDWMLITAGNKSNFNTMTASWGLMGVLWNKPVALCFIRPQRFTFEFVNASDYFTLSFFKDEFKTMLNYCGKYSGRNVNKIKETGLNVWETPHNNISFEQASLVLECRKIYTDFIKPELFIDKDIDKLYPQNDYHKMFLGEIMAAYKS